jgi:hypothetical protein
MISLYLLLIVPLQTLYLMIRSFLTYLRDPNREDARYALRWGLCVMTAMLFITGEIEVQGKPAWMTVDLPAGGWVIYNMCLNIGALGIIYYGVAISQILTGENLKKLSRCRFLLGLTLFVMTPLDFLYQTSGNLFFYRLYGLTFLPVSLGYTSRIIYVYHTRAKYAKPSTKWRIHFAKWGCIFCLLSPMELIVPFKTLAIRPSLLLVIMAWTLFILSGVTPH